MSGELRIILVLASIVTCIYISRKLKKSQVAGYDMVFWLLFSGVLIVVSIFPQIVDWCSGIMGIYSSENMIFLIIIFALLIRVFLLSIKSSQLERKIVVLVEELAVKEKMKEQNENKSDI